MIFRTPTLVDVPHMVALFDAEVPAGHFKPVGPDEATTSFMKETVEKGRSTMIAWQNEPPREVKVWAEIVEKNDRIIGLAINKDWCWPMEAGPVRGRAIELWYLVVDPAERRSGIGTILLNHQMALAKRTVGSKGFIFSRCFKPSRIAKSMLLKIGFKVETGSSDQDILLYRTQ